MAKIYGVTKLDPVNAPIGIVSDGTAVILPQGFSVPAGKDGSIGRNLTVGGSLTVSGTINLSGAVNTISNTTNLSTLNVSQIATFSSSVSINNVSTNLLPNGPFTSNVSTINLGSTSARWGTGYFGTVDANTISSTSITTTNITISGNLGVTGSISFPSGLSFSGTTTFANIATTGTVNLGSTSIISVNGKINTPVLPSVASTYDVGSTSFRWGTGYFSAVNSTTFTGKSLLFSDSTNPIDAYNTTLSFFGQGTFTGTWTGFSAAPSTNIFSWVRIGSMVVFSASSATNITGTSSTNAMTITGLPSHLRPAANVTLPHIVIDAGVATVGRVVIGTDGTLTFSKDANGTGFTTSGTKGIPALSGCYTIQ